MPGLVHHLVVTVLVVGGGLGVDVELLQVEAAVHVRKDPSPDAILEQRPDMMLQLVPGLNDLSANVRFTKGNICGGVINRAIKG